MKREIKDPETYWEEKVQIMLDLLNKSPISDEIKEEIEDEIFMDEFDTINGLKEYLEKLEKNISSY